MLLSVSSVSTGDWIKKFCCVYIYSSDPFKNGLWCSDYSSASKSNLKLLDVVHNAGVRYVTGVFRTSPTVSLYGDGGMTSLHFRRHKLLLSYASRVLPLRTHLNHTPFTENRRAHVYIWRCTSTRSSCVRTFELFN